MSWLYMKTKYSKWTRADDILLAKSYPRVGQVKILKIFPHRTIEDIKIRSRLLGCVKKSYWTQKETKIVIDNFESRGAKYVSEKTGRSEDSVYWKAYSLGLKRPCLSRRGELSYQYKGYKGISGSHWHRIQRNAKRRKLGIDLSIEYCWELFEKQSAKCALSGLDISFSSRVNSYDGTASLDRIDSTKGYLKGNVQWVHKDINKMKWDMSDSDFIRNCQAVIDYHKS